ncbi:twin-arginine translocation pathway signal [Streptococcus pneumoniae]|nr:twin-arginine translocation pathway signal [Streptococcus pneumoniae]
MIYSKEIVREWLDEVAERAKDHPEWVDVFERCYTDTLDNTIICVCIFCLKSYILNMKLV